MARKLSIYDLDYTLCRKDTFNLFYRYLLKSGLISPNVFFVIMLRHLLFLLGVIELKRVRESVLMALGGKDKAEINAIVLRFLSELKHNHYRLELLEAVKHEKEEGYILVLLTAAPDIYANKIGENLGFSNIIASKTEYIVDKFTGRILEDNLKGKQKLKVLQREINLAAYDLSSSRGYGNKDDVPWLNLLGHVLIYK